MKRLWPAFVLVLAGCSSRDKQRLACDHGDAVACDALAIAYSTRTTDLCRAADSGAPPCDRYSVKSIPLEAPKLDASNAGMQTVLSVTLTADGKTLWDGTPVADDSALLELAKAAHATDPDLRVVIKADKDASHGAVIHLLDMLKQAGVSRIAFGVSPVAPVDPSRTRN